MTIRPWDPDEVPVGAVVRRVRRRSAPYWRALITGISEYGVVVYLGVPGARDFASVNANGLLDDYEWRWPHEADDAWRECGVEE